MGVRQQARRGIMISLIVVGALAMFASTQQDRIWWIFVGFLVGMTSLSLLLLQVGDALDDRLAQHIPPWWPGAFSGLALGGLGVLVVAIWLQLNPITAIAGMVLFTVGLIGLFLWVGRRSGPPGLATEAVVGPDDVPPPSARIGVGSATWYGFEAMAIGIGLLLISDGTASLFGVIAWMFGLVTVKVASLPYLASRGRGIHRTVRILIDIALVGLFLLFAGAFTSNSVLLLVGLSIVTASLSMIGIGVTHVQCKTGKVWWVLGVSSLAIIAIWGWVAAVTQNPGLAFVFGLIIALAGGFFVLRGEGIVLLMMVGYVLAWGLVDRSSLVAEAAIDPSDSRPTIVALGDSFISGEGAAEFFAGTNEAGGNQCRRAPTSHPYLVAEALDAQVLSVACSGAKIGDLILCGQMWPDGRRCRIDGWTDELDKYRDRPAGPVPQLVTATERGLGPDVDVVLVSIGGNDVGFSSIVKACLLPKGCDERREIWLDSVDLLGPKLDEIYADIAVAFPNAQVMVVPYPMIVKTAEQERCDLGLSQGEREFVVDFIQKLDSVIEQAVERAGFVYLDTAVQAYEGFQLCDEVAAANHLRLVPPEGDKLGRYSPATWIPGSMHPNELGHELTAAAIVCPVAGPLLSDQLTVTIGETTETCVPTLPATGPDESPAETTASAAAAACEAALGVEEGAGPGDESTDACAAVAEAVDTQIGALAAEVAAVSDELVSDDEWIRVELFRTIRALALPLVLLLAAGLTFAWAFVQLNNPLSRFLAQRTEEPRR